MTSAKRIIAQPVTTAHPSAEAGSDRWTGL